MAEGNAAHRLDTFVDAAFAFAVTLLVAGSGTDSLNIETVLAGIAPFAIGFAIIAMFWTAHVRWRSLRGDGGARAMVLSLLLTFVVLIYIGPLKLMAQSFAGLLTGGLRATGGNVAMLFTVYGIGFTAMSMVTALLFRDALANPGLGSERRAVALGETWIWSILAWTGILSTIAALAPWPYRSFAPFLYATLPLTIGLFSWRWNWRGRA